MAGRWLEQGRSIVLPASRSASDAVRRLATPDTAYALLNGARRTLADLFARVEEAVPEAVGAARKLAPGLPWPERIVREVDPVLVLLADLDALDPKKQGSAARNLALLWECFVEEFGGISGFQEASDVQKSAYLAKLEAAALRMEAGRGTDAAYHYVSVALMGLYVSFFQNGRADAAAVALSNQVAALINRGRQIRALEVRESAAAAQPKPGPVARVLNSEVEVEKSTSGGFRVGFVSQPSVRASV